MGCSDSRQSFLNENISLESLESGLGFGKNSSTMTDLIIRKYSSEGVINKDQ